MGATTATHTRSGTSIIIIDQVFNHVHGWADFQLIATRHSSEVKGQQLLMMDIQITHIRNVPPQPVRQLLTLVSRQQCGHLIPDCSKDYTYKSFVSHHKPPKPAFHNNHSQIWVCEMLNIHLTRMQPSLRPEASCPDITRQGNQTQEPETPTRDAYQRPKYQNTTVHHTETKPRSSH